MGKRTTSSDEWYGFYHPFEFVEDIYWRRRNSGYVLQAEEGGMLDQDDHLEKDLDRYALWYGMAEARVDDEKVVMDKANSR